MERLFAAFRQASFGGKSERADPDQFDLALEDLETAIATIRAEEGADVAPSKRASKPRATNRGSLPGHLPRIEEDGPEANHDWRSEEHTSELQSLMRISYADFCLHKKIQRHTKHDKSLKDINDIHIQQN